MSKVPEAELISLLFEKLLKELDLALSVQWVLAQIFVEGFHLIPHQIFSTLLQFVQKRGIYHLTTSRSSISSTAAGGIKERDALCARVIRYNAIQPPLGFIFTCETSLRLRSKSSKKYALEAPMLAFQKPNRNNSKSNLHATLAQAIAPGQIALH